jgi:hypothetical protein
MKKAFIVTSSIEVDNQHPLTYSKVRTAFDSEERFRQTVMTVASLDLACDKNDTTIYILDTSENWKERAATFLYQPNLKFISVKEFFPDIFDAVRTHPHKSYCECLLLSRFIKDFRKELSQYDYLFKLTGRYFVDSSFNTEIFNEENLNKIFFKHPLGFEWHDAWGYNLVDRRQQQNNNKLHQYCSVLFGWGKDHYDHFLDLFTAMTTMFSQPEFFNYDVETLIYYFTRPFEETIIETDWIIYGWSGASGQFMRY